ncbi:MAG: hypothetical protein LBM04_11505, partial [Opitutaceae bacterium]|nr:hypothetical protein [Opitutaceae bacterium]
VHGQDARATRSGGFAVSGRDARSTPELAACPVPFLRCALAGHSLFAQPPLRHGLLMHVTMAFWRFSPSGCTLHWRLMIAIFRGNHLTSIFFLWGKSPFL